MNLLFNFLLTQPGEGVTAAVADTGSAAADTVEVITNTIEGTTEAASSSGLGMWGMIAYIAFFVVIFYLFIIRPQKKKDKQLKEMQSSIQVGDEVVTSSGFFGKVVDINDEVAVVEFGTNKGVRIPVRKSEIYGNKSAQGNESKESK